MGSISDKILSGAMPSIESVHGEPVQILSGPDAGKSFVGVLEIEQDVTFDGEVTMDRRAKTVLRFRRDNFPIISKLDRIKTSDGRIWCATIQPQNSYLTVDFELVEKK